MAETRRKACAFCGRSDVKISREHAWPNWCRQLFPPGKTTVIGHLRKNEPMGTLRYSTYDMGVTVNDVCRDNCNNGWMSQLERAIQPLLAPMAQRGARTTLDETDQQLLARWAVKTAMVFEFTTKEPAFYTPEQRLAMAKSREMPWPTTLVLVRHKGELMSYARGVRIRGEGDDDSHTADGQTVQVTVHATTITIGEFGVQVISAAFAPDIRHFELPIPAEWAPYIIEAWPRQKTVARPPAQPLSSDQLDRFVRAPVGGRP